MSTMGPLKHIIQRIFRRNHFPHCIIPWLETLTQRLLERDIETNENDGIFRLLPSLWNDVRFSQSDCGSERLLLPVVKNSFFAYQSVSSQEASVLMFLSHAALSNRYVVPPVQVVATA